MWPDYQMTNTWLPFDFHSQLEVKLTNWLHIVCMNTGSSQDPVTLPCLGQNQTGASCETGVLVYWLQYIQYVPGHLINCWWLLITPLYSSTISTLHLWPYSLRLDFSYPTVQNNRVFWSIHPLSDPFKVFLSFLMNSRVTTSHQELPKSSLDLELYHGILYNMHQHNQCLTNSRATFSWEWRSLSLGLSLRMKGEYLIKIQRAGRKLAAVYREVPHRAL